MQNTNLDQEKIISMVETFVMNQNKINSDFNKKLDKINEKLDKTDEKLDNMDKKLNYLVLLGKIETRKLFCNNRSAYGPSWCEKFNYESSCNGVDYNSSKNYLCLVCNSKITCQCNINFNKIYTCGNCKTTFDLTL